MPLEIQIIRASEFIRLGARGKHDLATSCKLLRKLAVACRLRGINQALIDLRALHPGPTPMLSPKDLVLLVRAFCEMGFSDQLRLAVLYSSDPHHRAKLFALMTSLRGWHVKASDNFEEALHWISQEDDDERRKEAGGHEIPVRLAKSRKQPAKQKTFDAPVKHIATGGGIKRVAVHRLQH